MTGPASFRSDLRVGKRVDPINTRYFSSGDSQDYINAQVCNELASRNPTEYSIQYTGPGSDLMTIPISECIADATDLKTLEVHNIVYPTDAQLATLTSLQTLIFTEPQFTGEVQMTLDWMRQLTQLEYFEFRESPYVVGNLKFASDGEIPTLTTFIFQSTFIETLTNFFQTLTSLQILDLSHNHLKNTPTDVVPQGAYASVISVDLSYNKMTGTIATTFWTTLSNLASIAMSNNQLDGTLSLYINSKLTSMDLSSNALTQWIASGNPGSGYPLTDINLANNKLTTLPDFQNIPDSVNINLSNNPTLTTALPDLNSPYRNVRLKSFLADGCGFTGNLPSFLFVSTFDLRLRNNPLSGTIPTSYQSYVWTNMDVSGTGLDLCASTLPSTSMTCNVSATTIDVCPCYSARYSTCTSSCVVPAAPVIIVPIPAPLAPTPQTSSPQTTTPPPVAPTCPPPPAGFICVGGKLIANTSIATPTLTIPAGATVEISGDLSTSSLVFDGLGSSITLKGCANISEGITITFTKSDVERLGRSGNKTSIQTLLTQDASLNCSSLETVPLSTRLEKSGCKKVKSVKSANESTFGAVFTLDSSSCNTWWIILVSVIGGVVLLALGFGLLVAFVPSVRECVRPYSKRKQSPSTAI